MHVLLVAVPAWSYDACNWLTTVTAAVFAAACTRAPVAGYSPEAMYVFIIACVWYGCLLSCLLYLPFSCQHFRAAHAW
jgi:hypothetical protein